MPQSMQVAPATSATATRWRLEPVRRRSAMRAAAELSVFTDSGLLGALVMLFVRGRPAQRGGDLVGPAAQIGEAVTLVVRTGEQGADGPALLDVVAGVRQVG